MWSKERIVALNKLICEASDQPHALRDEGALIFCLKAAEVKSTMAFAFEAAGLDCTYQETRILSKYICERHPFVDGNKRTATCVAICETLKNI